MDRLPQERIDSLLREIATNLEKLRNGMEQSVFEKYVTAFDDFFKGTLIMGGFLQLCELLVPRELTREHEEVRNMLCEIGDTKLANKRIVRRKFQAKDAIIYRLPDFGDMRARIALSLASRGLLMESGLDEVIYEATRFYVMDILLYAVRGEVEHDGFIQAAQAEPLTINDFNEVLKKRSEDPDLNEAQRLLASKEVAREICAFSEKTFHTRSAKSCKTTFVEETF
ncbi:unnamed protein product, partial [Mesorhabditis belari]|uniref:Uncharacterized protein n=1 Tax=Mesorhabditis belari TaxID=2138241 RepID=A0AAF3EW83_9BILA